MAGLLFSEEPFAPDTGWRLALTTPAEASFGQS